LGYDGYKQSLRNSMMIEFKGTYCGAKVRRIEGARRGLEG